MTSIPTGAPCSSRSGVSCDQLGKIEPSLRRRRPDDSSGREAIAGRSPAELLELAVERLATCLGAELVASWRLDARSRPRARSARCGRIELEAGCGWGGEQPSVPIGSADAARALVDSPRIISADEGWDASGPFERAGIRTGMVVPVLGHGRSDGGLAVYSRERRRFSPDELESLAAVAELISAARARVRLARIEGHLEVARRQASLGALISGVAHDFNNMLSVIIGYARLMERDIGGSELLAEGIAEISVAAARAKHMSRELVDLGRPTRTEPEVLDVGAIVAEVGELLFRTLGDTVELRINPGSGTPTVLMPPGELDRVLVNLVANARDALPDGGRVEIRVRVEEAASPAEPGWAVVEVVDNGIGMSPALLEHVLEPSFTTKEKGEGSGIGLPSAETIVRSAGGVLELDSEPGAGTTARVRLPITRR